MKNPIIGLLLNIASITYCFAVSYSESDVVLTLRQVIVDDNFKSVVMNFEREFSFFDLNKIIELSTSGADRDVIAQEMKNTIGDPRQNSYRRSCIYPGWKAGTIDQI